MTIWTRRDGTTILIAAMHDAHLANAIAMVKRKLIAGLRVLDALEAEQATRTRTRGEDAGDGWRLLFEADEYEADIGERIRIWDGPRPRGEGDRGRIEVRRAMPLRLDRKVKVEFDVFWERGRANGHLRGDDWPAMVRAAKAVDAACSGPRRS